MTAPLILPTESHRVAAGSTATGRTLYVRSGPFAEDDQELVHSRTHHPFVGEDTVIFVKTGHLPIPLNTAAVE